MPIEKINKALDLIAYFVNPNNKKAMVLQVQRLCGMLNFLCKGIVPR